MLDENGDGGTDASSTTLAAEVAAVSTNTAAYPTASTTLITTVVDAMLQARTPTLPTRKQTIATHLLALSTALAPLPTLLTSPATVSAHPPALPTNTPTPATALHTLTAAAAALPTLPVADAAGTAALATPFFVLVASGYGVAGLEAGRTSSITNDNVVLVLVLVTPRRTHFYLVVLGTFTNDFDENVLV